MAVPRVLELGDDRRLLDLDFRDTEGLVAAYLLPEPDGWALVETGPTSCREALLRAVAAAGVDPNEIRHVLVTHIHLDHAGGLGAVADDFPNARLLAHEVGIPHLIDPTRLVAGARRAWGEASDRLWGPVAAVPAGRLQALRGGESIPLRAGTLTVLATPGHAKHHLAFFDSRLRALFTGDAAGVRLERSATIRPAVPPPDLDLDRLFDSLDRMRALEPRTLLLSHFGPTPDGAADLERYRRIVERWRDAALEVARDDPSVTAIAARLRELDPEGRDPADTPVALISGYELAAQGLLRYFRTHGDLPEAPA